MNNKKFKRKIKEDKPVLAICYDFDKTLSPDDMQAQGFIQEVGYDVKEFWTESNSLAEDNDMDQNLAYMYKMVENAEGTMIFNKKTLADYGAKIKLFPGVNEWFERIKKFGEENGVIVEHYIISSGLKEMIDGTEVAQNGVFEKIYASSFYYNEKGVAKWPAQVVNFTNKTQFLFRIEKGVLDINDSGVNEYFPPDKIRIPFRNMVYIGDSDTDIPCMKLVNSYGGNSIGVYNPETQDKTKVYKMINDNRIKYFVPADYSENTALDSLIKNIILKTAESEKLESNYFECQREAREYNESQQEQEKEKADLIALLENSKNFATTHMVVKELNKLKDWTPAQKNALFTIATDNLQVGLIIDDNDVQNFYTKLLNETNEDTPVILEIKKMLGLE